MYIQTPYVHAQTHTHTQTEETGYLYGLSQWNKPHLTPICLNMSHFKQCILRSPAEDLCAECVKGQEKSTSEGRRNLHQRLVKPLFLFPACSRSSCLTCLLKRHALSLQDRRTAAREGANTKTLTASQECSPFAPHQLLTINVKVILVFIWSYLGFKRTFQKMIDVMN